MEIREILWAVGYSTLRCFHLTEWSNIMHDRDNDIDGLISFLMKKWNKSEKFIMDATTYSDTGLPLKVEFLTKEVYGDDGVLEDGTEGVLVGVEIAHESPLVGDYFRRKSGCALVDPWSHVPHH